MAALLAALIIVGSWSVHVDSAAAVTRDRVLVLAPQNYDDVPTTLARILTSLGETVDVRTEQPIDLDVYRSIWWADPYNAMPAQLVNDLFVYLVDGGGVYLTGERPCCEPLNQSDQALLRHVLKDQDVVVGNQGDVDGPYSFNPGVTDHLATFPNELTTFLPVSPGGLAGLGGVSSRNVLAASPTTPVGAAWSEQDMTQARGRVALLMDINWADPRFRTDDQIRPIVENLANFLGNAGSPPSCPAVKVIGVAGSGENDQGVTLGAPVVPFVTALKESVEAMFGAGSFAEPKALDYTPVSVPAAAFAAFVTGNKSLYHASVDAGTSSLSLLFQTEATENLACLTSHQTRYVIAGYSQGAQVIGDALEDLAAVKPSDDPLGKKKALSDQIQDVVFFGDPKFNGADASVRKRSSFLAARTGIDGARAAGALSAYRSYSFCRYADPVCQGSRYVPGYFAAGSPHEQYQQFESYWAANNVAADLWRVPLKPLESLDPVVLATPVPCGSSSFCAAVGPTQYRVSCTIPEDGTCYVALDSPGGKRDLYLTPSHDSEVVSIRDVTRYRDRPSQPYYLKARVSASAPGYEELVPTGDTRIPTVGPA